jgi:hypothetical protein
VTDPAPENRVYYRHIDSGQRAFLVIREGQERLRIDHGPNTDVVVPLDPTRWSIDKESRPLNRAHLGEIAFVADRALCVRLARHVEARVQWRDLSDKERADFIEKGPRAFGAMPPIRVELYRAMLRALEPYTGK